MRKTEDGKMNDLLPAADQFTGGTRIHNSICSPRQLLAAVVLRHSYVADRLPVVLRFAAAPRVRLKTETRQRARRKKQLPERIKLPPGALWPEAQAQH